MSRLWVGIEWAGWPGTHGEVILGGRRGRAAHPLVGDIRMSRGCIFDYTPPEPTSGLCGVDSMLLGG